jgi:hypothetical protein
VDIRTLVLQLGDPDTDVRVAARDALVAAGPVAVSEIVAALLDEDSPVIPIVAAFGLRSYGDAAVGPVTEALAAAPSRKLMERVDWAYDWLQPSDPASFVAALRHPSATVRRSAASALYRLGAAPYIVDLLPLLSGPDPDVRSTARTSIFGAGADAVPTLQGLRRTPGRHRPFRADRIRRGRRLARPGPRRPGRRVPPDPHQAAPRTSGPDAPLRRVVRVPLGRFRRGHAGHDPRRVPPHRRRTGHHAPGQLRVEQRPDLRP